MLPRQPLFASSSADVPRYSHPFNGCILRTHRSEGDKGFLCWRVGVDWLLSRVVPILYMYSRGMPLVASVPETPRSSRPTLCSQGCARSSRPTLCSQGCARSSRPTCLRGCARNPMSQFSIPILYTAPRGISLVSVVPETPCSVLLPVSINQE